MSMKALGCDGGPQRSFCCFYGLSYRERLFALLAVEKSQVAFQVEGEGHDASLVSQL